MVHMVCNNVRGGVGPNPAKAHRENVGDTFGLIVKILVVTVAPLASFYAKGSEWETNTKCKTQGWYVSKTLPLNTERYNVKNVRLWSCCICFPLY